MIPAAPTVAAPTAIAAPAPLMKPNWWIPGEGSGWIDFAPRESGHIIIRVTINAEPAWALVDSGVEAMTLSKQFADRHHLALTPVPGRAAVSFGGDTPLYYAAGVNMTIGGVHTQGPSVFQAIDLASLSRFDVPLDAVIGLDLLRLAGLEVDEDHHRLRFVIGGRFDLPPHGTLRIGPEGARMVADVMIGDAQAVAEIDTGSDADLMIAPALVGKSGVEVLTDQMASGAGGNFVDGVGMAKTVALGGQHIATVRTDISDQILPVTHGYIPASIGMGLLRRYNFVLDLSQQALWLGERANPAPPEAVSTVGVQGDVASARGPIIHVMKNSPAAAVGLKSGDVVCTVNGRTPWPGWGRAAPGTRYAIGLCGGRTVDLVTRAFY